MPVQDLTPQLRTRLSRLERLVALFVSVATLLLLAGLAYYVYHLAESKGTFLTKVYYQTSMQDASGLKEGQSVTSMGFPIGKITRIEANAPGAWFNVTVDFVVHEPYYGYIWTDSRVRIGGLALLGSRTFEILKGRTGEPTVEEGPKSPGQPSIPKSMLLSDKIDQLTKDLAKAGKKPDEIQEAIKAAVKANRAAFSTNFHARAIYWLPPEDAPGVQERLETILTMAETALPNILELTNKLNRILTNAANAAEHADNLLVSARPAVTNLSQVLTNVAIITANLREPKGALGDWMLPTNLNQQVTLLLTNLNGTLTNVNTNLVALVGHLNESLEHLAGITSNLNQQVQANTNIVTSISDAIVHADDLMQGLKRHWLLRSAFKNKATPSAPNAAPPHPPALTQPGKHF